MEGTMVVNRVQRAIDQATPMVMALSDEKQQSLDEAMELSPQEHEHFQQLQSLAHISGGLSTDEATTVYRALGEIGSVANGGWAADADLVTKCVVTKLMGELVGIGS